MATTTTTSTSSSPPPLPPAKLMPSTANNKTNVNSSSSSNQQQQQQQHVAVRLNDMPWFHGKILRDQAEELLNPKENQDGLFLVRESTNFPGDYTLCVVFQGKVEHYRYAVN